MTMRIVVESYDRMDHDESEATGRDAKIFNIQAVLSDRDQATYDRLKRELCECDVDSDMEFPLFTVFQVGIVTSISAGLVNCIVVAQALRSWIQENDITHVRCGDLSLVYLHVVRDVGEQLGVNISVASRRQKYETIRARLFTYLSRFLSSLVLLIDQFCSMLVNAVRGTSLESEILLVPYSGRFESMRPVISEFATDSAAQVVVTHLKLPRLIGGKPRVAESFSADSVRFFHDYASFATVRESVRLLFLSVPRALFFRTTEQDGLTDFIEVKYCLRLDRSVAYTFSDNVIKGQEAIIYYALARSVVNASRCNCLVVGGDTQREMAITTRAERLCVQTYYVPHSLTSRHEPVHREGTTLFASSAEEVDFLEEIGQETANMHPIGRPYFDELSGESTPSARSSEAGSILIATQPLFPDTVREELVSTVLAESHAPDGGRSVVIKTHPSEDPDFYRKLLDGPLADFEADIRITDENLDAELRGADLTVTITSNVGLESIALGTPTVVIDKRGGRSYSPRYPYQELAPIPILQSDADVAAFFADLDSEIMADLLRKQKVFFADTYPDPDRASADIAAYLRENCTV